MVKRKRPLSNNATSDPGPLADTLGCPPTSLAELATLDRDRQQQLATLIEACQQRQYQAHEQALRAALPRFLHPLLGTVAGSEP
jgi:hypothetical protein